MDKKHNIHKKITIRLTEAFSSAIIGARRQWSNILKVLRGNQTTQNSIPS